MSEENKFIRLFGNQIPILGILPVSEDKTGEELFAESSGAYLKECRSN